MEKISLSLWNWVKGLKNSMTNLDRKDLFDKWAKNYDESVISAKDYPFDGYERVLDRIVEIVKPNPKIKVLDFLLKILKSNFHFYG